MMVFFLARTIIAAATRLIPSWSWTGTLHFYRCGRFDQHIGSHPLDGNLVTQVVFDFRDRINIFLSAKTHCIATGTGARRPAYPMNIILGVLRQIKIKNMAHIRNVQASRGKVGGNQDG